MFSLCVLAGDLISGIVGKVCVFFLCVLAGDLISGLVGKVCVLIVCPCWQSDFRFVGKVCAFLLCVLAGYLFWSCIHNFFNVFLGGFAFSASKVLSSVVGARAVHI